MAASRTLSPDPAAQEVFSWLKNLPLAPEYHPTVAEFQDPIAYIFKIEKEASSYGICKIVPPVPPAPKKSVISNFNRSLAARSTESTPTFTTRQQQVGFCPRKPCPVKKPVWQSGESYTFQDFETKARAFERNYLKKCSKKSSPSALEIETLYWKATVDKPISVEYANDMPGSAFTPLSSRKGKRETGEGQGNVGDSNWNMRGVSRWVGSLLKFMKEEIPGVTSPMVYVAMLFSWFAWHVEDHDLHSLNYMHLGAGKTWYGVPRDAAVAFEEVARVHGYGGEVNPLVTFAILGEKTTVISPEVLVGAGVPCCSVYEWLKSLYKVEVVRRNASKTLVSVERKHMIFKQGTYVRTGLFFAVMASQSVMRLVQNAGEFVVTFPRAYHSGFSHGFNCGEAANIATPEWLKFAKDAAIRRASINYPPMVSHFQLLYDLALALCSRVPTTINLVPRSSRLKDKKKSEGESMIKEEFVHDVIQNNNLLHTLCKGANSSVVLLPQNSSDISSSCQNLHVGANSRLALGLCDPTDEDERINNPLKGGSSYSIKAKFSSLYERRVSSYCGNRVEDSQEHGNEDKSTAHLGDMLSDQRLFLCVTCGILTFSCAAIIQPKAPAARYLRSAECSLLNDWTARSIEQFDEKTLDSGLRHFGDCKTESPERRDQNSSSFVQQDKGSSALGLIGLNYGNSSDSEQDDEIEHVKNEASVCDDIDGQSCRNLDFSSRFEMNTTRYGSVGELKPKDTSYVPPIYSEESSLLHVFCLEHAIEVEKQLRPIGGAEIFLICHADYPKIEVVAKSIAEEFGDDFVWNEITFRNANKEDKERIKAALDSDNVTPNSGDWTVKLGANLFYSVHLSWSSLYSKQMPYNPIIQKAFGRRTRRDDEDDEDYGKRSRKKIVEGKWCGKVWMSNQIHPILAHKYNNEENEAHEEDERNYFHSSDEKHAKGKSVNTSTVTKRKKKAAAKSNRSLKERRTSLYKEDEEVVSDEDVVKSIENNTDSDDNSLEENYRRQQPRGRIYGGSNSKAAEFTPVEDVMNSDVSQSGDSEPPRGEFSDEESAPPPKIYSRRKKQSLIDDVPVISNENCRRPWSLRNKKLKQDLTSSDNSNREMMSPTLNPGLANGRISLPVRQRTPRIASKNVAALCLERQVGGFVEEEEEECQGPSTRLRMKKPARPAKGSGREKQQPVSLKKKATVSSKKKKVASTSSSKLRADEGGEHGCDIEGCGMSFRLKHELTLHMKNICPVKGCGKKFFSHKYLVQHRRVHDDDRPLKCPWKGCKMTFKWAWARTEHIRVHTGVRPYVCGEPGCGQTFRFVSDFSRHKRKTGHSIKGKG